MLPAEFILRKKLTKRRASLLEYLRKIIVIACRTIPSIEDRKRNNFKKWTIIPEISLNLFVVNLSDCPCRIPKRPTSKRTQHRVFYTLGPQSAKLRANAGSVVWR